MKDSKPHNLMMTASKRHYERAVHEQPETISDWLNKWEPKIKVMSTKKNRGKSIRAGNALDELEFLLARTVENQVAE